MGLFVGQWEVSPCFALVFGGWKAANFLFAVAVAARAH